MSKDGMEAASDLDAYHLPVSTSGSFVVEWLHNVAQPNVE